VNANATRSLRLSDDHVSTTGETEILRSGARFPRTLQAVASSATGQPTAQKVEFGKWKASVRWGSKNFSFFFLMARTRQKERRGGPDPAGFDPPYARMQSQEER